MINENDKIILGLSGGADSTALFHLLIQIQNQFNLQIIATHLNHNLRKDEADKDEKFVKNLCASHKIIFESRKISVKDFAAEKKISTEEAGRICRYNFFYDMLKKYCADKIAVAHNKNDNAETILMKLIRGCGTNGLCGINPVYKKIIRPLININRLHIENYCAQNNFEYRIDSSNLKCKHTRNKIRNKIFPQILEINPNFIDTIIRSTKIICQENNYLNEKAIEIINSFPNKNKIPVSEIISLSKVLQTKIIHIITKNISFADFSSRHINSILELISKPNGKKICLPHNLIAHKISNEIIFYKIKPNSDFEYKIELNKPIFIPQIKKNLLVTNKNIDAENYWVCTNFFYCDNINELTVRNYKIGDRIFFKNFGHKKLKKLFTEKKIPVQSCSSILILTANNNIVWIIGKDINVISNNDNGKKYFIYIWED